MSPLSVLKLELSLYTHGPLVCLMIFQLSVYAEVERLGYELSVDCKLQ